MSEYKTKLEEFTLEELQRIVSEAPAGWEEYSPAEEDVFEAYYKNCRYLEFCLEHVNNWYKKLTLPIGFSYISREDIEMRVNLSELVTAEDAESLRKQPSNPASVEISEFVNEVKFVDGKIYLDMDKQDIEGVIKMLEEIRGGEEN